MFGNSKIGTPFKGYYITAYGIAVKHGFVGSEEEWLESLNGGNAEFRYNSETKMIEYKHSKTEEWTEMMTLSEFQEGVIKDTLTEIKAAKETAVTASEAAIIARVEAFSAAGAVSDDKALVSALKENVVALEENTKSYSDTAKQASASAQASALAADEAADLARADREVVELSKAEVLTAEENAKNYSERAGADKDAVSEMLLQVQSVAQTVADDKAEIIVFKDEAQTAADEAERYAEDAKAAFDAAESAELIYEMTDVDLTTCTTESSGIGTIGSDYLSAGETETPLFHIDLSGWVSLSVQTANSLGEADTTGYVAINNIPYTPGDNFEFEGDVDDAGISVMVSPGFTYTFTSFTQKGGDAVGSTSGMMPEGSLKMLHDASEKINTHIAESANPHNVTAEQVGAYTKTEIDTKLGDIDTALDSILAMQENLIGGETA